MVISKTTQAAIQHYARQQTHLRLVKNEQTYFEQLGARVGSDIHYHGLFRFRPKTHLVEADELAGYMIDYIQAQMAAGQSESAALAQAEQVFTVDAPDNPLVVNPAYHQWQTYYAQLEQVTYKLLTLIFGSRLLIGTVVGTMLGVLAQSRYDHRALGWVFWLLLGLGILLGLGLGLASALKAAWSER
ncbi:hypothetical protein [Loigolactobacillus rennini]|uniref:Uncharacterized protein n=1 Tax=Loigolactobacillus rennini DSM 20253 TaxID=1423796 RepID=A0A0R2DHI0_9LACO|nr:hypothetical protein [Loigolactobacillus rennini]KRM99427.1 hypothetical protein FC24_GL000287 [Loigolactobacillus rennini DSM 20253]